MSLIPRVGRSIMKTMSNVNTLPTRVHPNKQKQKQKIERIGVKKREVVVCPFPFPLPFPFHPPPSTFNLHSVFKT